MEVSRINKALDDLKAGRMPDREVLERSLMVHMAVIRMSEQYKRKGAQKGK